jgi:hypothetical protein
MGELKYNSAYPQVNGAYPTPYKLAGVGVQIPSLPNFAGIPSTSFSDQLNAFKVTPQLNLPAMDVGGLMAASGMPVAPTIGGASNFSNGGFNLDLFNNASNIEGNPLGLKLGAEAGGGLPKIAMTDKINTGVGLFNSAVNAISAYKALQLGKDNLNFQKDSFNKNFAAMKGTTNAEMEDRQARRVRYDAQNGLNNHLSVSEYMAKFGVK